MEYEKCQLGVEIRGIDLKKSVSPEIVDKIRQDVHKYKLLIFKDQGIISGERHVEISKWMGELESTFYKHPQSPHPDIFRVSNEQTEGCRNVGRTGWHIDGSFMREPFRFALYHIVAVPKVGSTSFFCLNELINRLTPERRRHWERLWMVSSGRYDIIHPLIYPHPTTGEATMCFHLGMTEEVISNYGQYDERILTTEESNEVLDDIHSEIKKNSDIIYTHKWEVGDFIISDNLAVGHEATPETQHPISQVGLRVLHRTTIKGINSPQKS